MTARKCRRIVYSIMPTLYPHQAAGVEWLAAHPRALLADEQGLGKTAQAILAADRVGARTLMVVAPAAVTHNWRRELRTWSKRSEAQILARGTDLVLGSTVIVSHDLVRSPKLLAQLCSPWDAIIVDEAHGFKNPSAQRTKALYGKQGAGGIVEHGKHVWALTGTPTPNDPSELYTMIAALSPDRIRTRSGRVLSPAGFAERYCQIDFRGRVCGVKNKAELHQRLRGFGLRRTKADVLDLPPVRHGRVLLSSDDVDPKVLAELLELESKIDVEALLAGRETESFSRWRRLCGAAKAKPAAEVIADELDNGLENLVVFGHHRDVLDTIEARLVGYGVVRIAGEVSAAGRQKAVDDFQARRARVALCQLVAGGVGITLTAAADVCFVEQSFSPGQNAQAMDRLHRIGQGKSVLVRRFVLEGSVDDVVDETLERKRRTLEDLSTVDHAAG